MSITIQGSCDQSWVATTYDQKQCKTLATSECAFFTPASKMKCLLNGLVLLLRGQDGIPVVPMSQVWNNEQYGSGVNLACNL